MRQPEWKPDFGPSQPHESAGATVIGARMPLVAYNINLATDRLDVAKKIAAAIRMSSGGYRYVKAMGLALEDRGVVQVSMNLTNYEKTPIFRVFETVKREAARYGSTSWRARSSDWCRQRRSRTRRSSICSLPGSRQSRSSRINSVALVSLRGDGLFTGRRDPERPHLFIEVRSLHPKHVGGARDVALLRRERLENVVALESFARLGEWQRGIRWTRESWPSTARRVQETRDPEP